MSCEPSKMISDVHYCAHTSRMNGSGRCENDFSPAGKARQSSRRQPDNRGWSESLWRSLYTSIIVCISNAAVVHSQHRYLHHIALDLYCVYLWMASWMVVVHVKCWQPTISLYINSSQPPLVLLLLLLLLPFCALHVLQQILRSIRSDPNQSICPSVHE